VFGSYVRSPEGHVLRLNGACKHATYYKHHPQNMTLTRMYQKHTVINPQLPTLSQTYETEQTFLVHSY